MKTFINKTVWIICTLFIMQSYLSSVSAQRTVQKGIEFIPFSLPPLTNGRDVASWTYKSSCFVSIDHEKKLAGRIYDDIQCTQFDVFNKQEDNDLTPYVYLKMKLPNSTDLLSAISFGGATDYNTEVMFTIDAQGNVKDTLEVGMCNSGLGIKEYKITADYKVVVSRLVVTKPQQPVIIVEFYPGDKTVTGYREDTTYSIDENGRFVKEKVERCTEKTYTRAQLEEIHAWEL